MAVKVILLDLDGTLLSTDKTISPANYAALERAAAMGVHIVPATGRFYEAMPAVVRELPFVRYVVTVNGAEIYDAREKKVLHREELTSEQAIRVYDGELRNFFDNPYMAAKGRPGATDTVYRMSGEYPRPNDKPGERIERKCAQGRKRQIDGARE